MNTLQSITLDPLHPGALPSTPGGKGLTRLEHIDTLKSTQPIVKLSIDVLHLQKRQIQSLTPAKFAVREGPFVQALDASLKSCGVEQQAYHGGSFVGNHVNECLKVGLNTYN